MSTGASVIWDYLGMSDVKRVDFIFRNYGNLYDYIEGYEETLCEEILEQRLYGKRRDPLGVRVKTSVCADTTARDAISHADIICKIRANDVEEIVVCCDEPETICYEVNVLCRMRGDLRLVNNAMGILARRERQVFLNLLNHEIELRDLADQRSIEYESAKMWVYRNKQKVKSQALEYMRKVRRV